MTSNALSSSTCAPPQTPSPEDCRCAPCAEHPCCCCRAGVNASHLIDFHKVRYQCVFNAIPFTRVFVDSASYLA